MDTIKTLTENIVSFTNDIAEHYGLPKEEIAAALNQINFYALYQTLKHKATPVLIYHAGGEDNSLMKYRTDELLPSNAILLYRDEDYRLEEDEVTTAHYLEVWLMEDLTLAVTACFRIVVEDVGYFSAFRCIKGNSWPYGEEIFDMDKFFHTLALSGPETVCVCCQPFYEP